MPGDLQPVEARDKVPADLRLIRSPWSTGSSAYEIGPAGDGSVRRQGEEPVPRRLLRPFRRVAGQQSRPRLRPRLGDITSLLEEEQEAPAP